MTTAPPAKQPRLNPIIAADDPEGFIRTWDNFGGQKGANNLKTAFEDVLHAAARQYGKDADPTNTYISATKSLKTGATAAEKTNTQVEHYYELQFLKVLFSEIVPDNLRGTAQIADITSFVRELCNADGNLVHTPNDVHADKNKFFTATQPMTQPLLDYLKACEPRFKKLVDDLIAKPPPFSAFEKNTDKWIEFLNCLKKTSFYTGGWPPVGTKWWLP